jgi:hypothetical protein
MNEPLEAYACMLTGAVITEKEAGVTSNVGKQAGGLFTIG